MSLSDEERQTKLYWSIHHLVQESRNLPATGYGSEGYTRLRELADQVWFAFLGHSSNGGHWIMGSSAGNKIGKPNSPWAVALSEHFETDRSRDQKDWMDEVKEQKRKEYNEQYKKDRDLADFPDDGIINHSVDIKSLLGHAEGRDHGKGLAAVYLIYAYTENLIYALRRYNDEFLAGYPVLNKLIADIQGECFGIFAKHEDFAKAYLLNQILEDLFAFGNPVGKMARHQHWHHHLPRAMRHASLKDMRQWHLSLVKDPKKVTPTDWIVLAFEIMGPAYEYEHQYQELIRMATKRGIALDVARVRKAFDACLQAEKETSESSMNEYHREEDYDHMDAVHGHDAAHKYIWEPAYKKRVATQKPKRVKKPHPMAKKRAQKRSRKAAVKTAETTKPEETKTS